MGDQEFGSWVYGAICECIDCVQRGFLFDKDSRRLNPGDPNSSVPQQSNPNTLDLSFPLIPWLGGSKSLMDTYGQHCTSLGETGSFANTTKIDSSGRPRILAGAYITGPGEMALR